MENPFKLSGQKLDEMGEEHGIRRYVGFIEVERDSEYRKRIWEKVTQKPEKPKQAVVYRYISGKRHREDGPAIEWANGDKYWWVDGRFVKWS